MWVKDESGWTLHVSLTIDLLQCKDGKPKAWFFNTCRSWSWRILIFSVSRLFINTSSTHQWCTGHWVTAPNYYLNWYIWHIWIDIFDTSCHIGVKVQHWCSGDWYIRFSTEVEKICIYLAKRYRMESSLWGAEQAVGSGELSCKWICAPAAFLIEMLLLQRLQVWDVRGASVKWSLKVILSRWHNRAAHHYKDIQFCMKMNIGAAPAEAAVSWSSSSSSSLPSLP